MRSVQARLVVRVSLHAQGNWRTGTHSAINTSSEILIAIGLS
jgi:hypothetical protein